MQFFLQPKFNDLQVQKILVLNKKRIEEHLLVPSIIEVFFLSGPNLSIGDKNFRQFFSSNNITFMIVREKKLTYWKYQYLNR